MREKEREREKKGRVGEHQLIRVYDIVQVHVLTMDVDMKHSLSVG